MSTILACYHCSSAVDISALKALGFRDSCPSCNRDAHICRNCEMFDESAHHGCRESSAEWVQDKERANRCEYFTPRVGKASTTKPTADTLAALDALFKK